MRGTPVFLPGESQGRGSLVGCRLWGRRELDTTEATYEKAGLKLNIQKMIIAFGPITSWQVDGENRNNIFFVQAHGLSGQECWSGLPWPPPGIFPTQGLSSCLLLSALAAWEAFLGCEKRQKELSAFRPTYCSQRKVEECDSFTCLSAPSETMSGFI